MSTAATMTVDDARRSILAAADDLFYGRGIAGVAMSDVRDLSGTSMRRLYSLYPSKSDLVAGWLNDRHRSWMDWFAASVEKHTSDSTEALLATFDALGEWISSPGYRGCAFINSIAETSQIDATHRSIIAGHKRDLIDHLAAMAIRDHPNAPDWLPAAVGVILDGAIVQCAIFGNALPLAAARLATNQLLETIPT